MFASKTGWGSADLEGKLVLDAGCGMGRFAEVAASHGARVVGVDLSPGGGRRTRERRQE